MKEKKIKKAYEGLKPLIVHVPVELHEQLKVVLSDYHGCKISIQQGLNLAIKDFVEKNAP